MAEFNNIASELGIGLSDSHFLPYTNHLLLCSYGLRVPTDAKGIPMTQYSITAAELRHLTARTLSRLTTGTKSDVYQTLRAVWNEHKNGIFSA